MPPREQAQQQLLDHFLLADHGLGQFAQDFLPSGANLFDGLLLGGVCFGLGTHDKSTFSLM
jgi:hypothetical protein